MNEQLNQTPAAPAQSSVFGKIAIWLFIVGLALGGMQLVRSCRSEAAAAVTKAAPKYSLVDRSSYRVVSNGPKFKIQIQDETGWHGQYGHIPGPSYDTLEEAELRICTLINRELQNAAEKIEETKFEWTPVTENLRSRFAEKVFTRTNEWWVQPVMRTNTVTECASCKPRRWTNLWITSTNTVFTNYYNPYYRWNE